LAVVGLRRLVLAEMVLTALFASFGVQDVLSLPQTQETYNHDVYS
jgi:hypothetical protein